MPKQITRVGYAAIESILKAQCFGPTDVWNRIFDSLAEEDQSPKFGPRMGTAKSHSIPPRE